MERTELHRREKGVRGRRGVVVLFAGWSLVARELERSGLGWFLERSGLVWFAFSSLAVVPRAGM